MQKQKSLWSRHLTAVVGLLILLTAALGCNLRSDADWKNELGRKKLSRASNSGAISNTVDIYFCPGGEYAMQTQFSGFSTGGAGTLSSADENVEYGRWSVQSSILVLKSQNGKTYEYNLSQGSNDAVIELNDNGYLVSTHNECER